MFDPDGIEFNSFPTMAKHTVKAMPPDRDGEVHKLSLHGGEVHWIELCIFRLCKSKYAGKLYLQFEIEESWDRPGFRAFGRVNSGLVF